MSKKVLFLYRNEDYALDGMRSALGLAVENQFSFGVVTSVELPELDDYNKENIDWIRDMEGDILSSVPANCDKNGLTPITLEEIGQKMREMDFVIPYGI